MNKSFENAMEAIGQAVFEMFDKNTPQPVSNLLSIVNEGYVLVQWPESQEYMEEEWFDEEAIFCGGSEDKTGGSAYFIPIKYVV
jgi:hypothetical protein